MYLSVNPSRCSSDTVRQKMYLIAALLLTAEASLGNACGAAAAFGKEEISIFVLILSCFFTFDLLSTVLSDVD